MNLADAALEYVRRGWHIFPLAPNTKLPHRGLPDVPAGDGGFKFATTDESHVRAWWTRWPDANIGLCPGPSGLLVVDIDNADGERVAQELGLLSQPTLTAWSAGWYLDDKNKTQHRRHHYYRHPGGHVANAKLRGVLEVKADSGYVVLPPSRVLNGRGELQRYRFVGTLDELLDLPSAALKAVRQNGRGGPAPPLPPVIHEGSRNDTLTSFAGSMRQRGVSEAGMLAALRVENQRCDPPLDDPQLQKIAKSVARYPPHVAEEQSSEVASDAWDAPVPFDRTVDLPSFPVDALPEWLRRFVVEEATATQTPVDLAGMMGLGTLAATVAGKVEIQVKPGYAEPLNLFVVTVLPPGNRKSGVFVTMIYPIQEFEKDERERLGPEIEAARSAYKIQEGELKKAEKDAVQAAADKRAAHKKRALELAQEFYGTPEPVIPRFICDDCTPERLAALLYEQGGRMAVFSPEGDVFEIMAGRYSRNASPNFAVFQKGHTGDGLYVDRIGRKAELVERPTLTVALAVQPDVIHYLTNKPGFRGRGLLGRFLYALPPSPLGHREIRPSPVTDDAREDYRLGMRYLLRLPPGTDDAGKRRPQLLRLDHQADMALAAFEAWIEPQLAPTGALGSITDWSGKLFGATARIAGLLHLAKNAARVDQWSANVEVDTVEAAIRIAKYLIPHALAAYNMMGADATLEAAQHLLRWLTDHDERVFTKRDAFNANRGRFNRVPDMEPALRLLEEHGYLRAEETPSKARGRPKSQRYTVHPNVTSHKSHNTHNTEDP